MPKFYLCDTMGKPSTGAPSEIMGDFSAIGHDCPKCGGVASKGRTLAWLATEAGAGGEATFPCMSCGVQLVFPRDAFRPEMLEALGKHFQPNALLRATTPEEVLQPNWGALLYRANGADLPDSALEGDVVSSTAGEAVVEPPAESAAVEEIEMPDDAGALEEVAGAVESPGLDLEELGGGLEEETPKSEESAPIPEPFSLEDELEAPLYTQDALKPETPENLELDTGDAGTGSGEGFSAFDDELGEALDGAGLLDDRPGADAPAAPEPPVMEEPPGLDELPGGLEEPAPAAAESSAAGEDWLRGDDAGAIVFDDAPAPLEEPAPASPAPAAGEDWLLGDDASTIEFDEAPARPEEPGPGAINLDEEPDVDMDFETPRAEADTPADSEGFPLFDEDVSAAPAPPAGWSGHGPCPSCGHDAPQHQSQRLACPACTAMFWVRGDALERESDTTLSCPCCRHEFVVPVAVWCPTCKQNTHGFRRVSELIRQANGLSAAATSGKPGRLSRGKRA